MRTKNEFSVRLLKKSCWCGCWLQAVRYWLLAVRCLPKAENAICYPHIYPYYAPNGAENVAENAICYPYHASNGVGNAAFTRHYQTEQLFNRSILLILHRFSSPLLFIFCVCCVVAHHFTTSLYHHFTPSPFSTCVYFCLTSLYLLFAMRLLPLAHSTGCIVGINKLLGI